MTITLDLPPEIERGLLARAQAKGVSLTDYAQQVLTREAEVPSAPHRTGQELIDACARLQGMFTDEEIDTLFRRNGSVGRRVDLE